MSEGLEAAAVGAAVTVFLQQRKNRKVARQNIIWSYDHMREFFENQVQHYVDLGWQRSVAEAQTRGELQEWLSVNPDPRRA